MKRKEKLKKFARKAFPIIGISAISATFALALNAKFRGNACCDEVKKNLNSLIKKYNSHRHNPTTRWVYDYYRI